MRTRPAPHRVPGSAAASCQQRSSASSAAIPTIAPTAMTPRPVVQPTQVASVSSAAVSAPSSPSESAAVDASAARVQTAQTGRPAPKSAAQTRGTHGATRTQVVNGLRSAAAAGRGWAASRPVQRAALAAAAAPRAAAPLPQAHLQRALYPWSSMGVPPKSSLARGAGRAGRRGGAIGPFRPASTRRSLAARSNRW